MKGYFVKYIAIDYYKRAGKSKVRYFRDTLRSAQIIIETITYYNPLKIFLLQSIFTTLIGILSILLFTITRVEAFITSTFICIIGSFVMFSMGLQSDLLRKIKDK